MKTCPNCQAQNADEAQFCNNCGFGLAAPAAPSAPAQSFTPAPPPVARAQPATLPVRAEILAVGAAFAAGALVLLVLIIIAAVGDERSRTISLVRGMTVSLLDLYVFGLALFGGYQLVTRGLDLQRAFGHLTPWAKGLLVVIAGYLLFLPASFVSNRLFQFVTARGAEAAILAERFFEGLLVLLVAGAVYWRLARRKEI